VFVFHIDASKNETSLRASVDVFEVDSQLCQSLTSQAVRMVKCLGRVAQTVLDWATRPLDAARFSPLDPAFSPLALGFLVNVHVVR